MSEPRHESSEQRADGEGVAADASPEGLLAEALRAKAGQTGGNASVLADESSTDRITPPRSADLAYSDKSENAGISVVWVVVLAALLGLATGTLIGLLTVV